MQLPHVIPVLPSLQGHTSRSILQTAELCLTSDSAVNDTRNSKGVHWCPHTQCITQARLELADSAKLDEMVLQGSEQGTRANAVMLDPADLGPPDVVLIGNGWSIPVHRCTHMRHAVATLAMFCVWCVYGSQCYMLCAAL